MKIFSRFTKIRNSGFSLVELLIVMAIILVIVGIAVPHVLKARRNANETSAVASMRTISTSQLAYRISHGTYVNMDTLRTENLIDEVLAAGTKSGYKFDTAVGSTPSMEFTVTGEPLMSTGYTATGNRFYFVNQDQVIRFNLGSAANANSSPLNN